MSGTGITHDLNGLHELLVERNRLRLQCAEIENRVAATLAHLSHKMKDGNNRNGEAIAPTPPIVLQLSHVRD